MTHFKDQGPQAPHGAAVSVSILSAEHELQFFVALISFSGDSQGDPPPGDPPPQETRPPSRGSPP